MMNWLGLALTAAALSGAASVVDKIIVEKYIRYPLLSSFFLGTYGLVSALVVACVAQVHFEPAGGTLLAFFSGILELIYFVLYFTALRRNDPAVVVALSQITPVFTALWGYLVLGEVFNLTTYTGVIIMVVGAVLISLERRHDSVSSSIHLDSTLLWMIAACFTRSLSGLTLKHSLQVLSTWDGFFWPRLGIFAGVVLTVLVFGAGQQRLWTAIKSIDWRVNLLVMGNEIMALIGILAITLAYDQGPLTLVTASGSTQPLFILLFVWAINFIRKNTVPARTDKSLCRGQLLLLLLIMAGAYLLGRE